jgi:hypothetical protein
MKEVPQYHLFTTELLRSVLARSDDITLLRTLVERKASKAKFAVYCEKATLEAEAREEQRSVKENEILNYFSTARIDSSVQKKYLSHRQLENIARKLLSISAQFESDDVGFSNPSEQHVYMVMSEKLGEEPEEPCSARDSPTKLRPAVSSKSKILESCLFGESVSVALVLSHCVSSSREAFSMEICKCRKLASVDQMGALPKISVVVNPKMSVELSKKGNWGSNEWMKNMVLMLMNKNIGLLMKMQQFKEEATQRLHSFSEPSLPPSVEDLDRKLTRARSYEASGPFSPVLLPSAFPRQLCHYLLFDIDNAYFESSHNLEERIRTTHSVLTIQHSYKQYVQLKKQEALRHVANSIALHQALRTCHFLKRNRTRLRVALWRLRHWYPVLVNRWRERKDKKNYSAVSYQGLRFEIVDIQRLARGFLTRKRKLCPKKRKHISSAYEWKTFQWRYIFTETADTLAAYRELSQQLRIVRQAIVEDPRSAKVKRDRATTLERDLARQLNELCTAVKPKRVELIV